MGEYGGHHCHHHIIETPSHSTFQWRSCGQGGYIRRSSHIQALKKVLFRLIFDVLEQVGSRTFIIVAGCSMHVVITLRQLRCIRLNLAQVAKRSHGFAFRIHPSHVGTSPSLLIVRFWFDQVSPSLTASWHKFSVCSIREWERG